MKYNWLDIKVEKQIIARNKRNGSGKAVRYLMDLADKKNISREEFTLDDICTIVRKVLDEHKKKYGFDSIIPKM